ncbi:signal peptide peptidase SppA [Segnochrobactraceae bacterium EtOH-i3]
MSLDADTIVERRRTRRALALWRAAAVIAVVVMAGAWFLASSDVLGNRHQPHIARITISGVIAENRRLQTMIREIRDSPEVRGVVVAIDSPGGTTSGGEALYDALRDLSAHKPTVAVASTIATSAGYLVALATDRIVTRRNTITGSIGVLVQFGEISRLLDMIGVKMEAVKSAPLKATPNPTEPTSEATREMLASLVQDSYDWFVGLVAERRKMKPEVARSLADGRIVTGHQALQLGLIDAIGGEETGVTWLETERGIPRNLPVIDWAPARKSLTDSWIGSVVDRAIAGVAQHFGLTGTELVGSRALLSVLPGAAWSSDIEGVGVVR